MKLREKIERMNEIARDLNLEFISKDCEDVLNRLKKGSFNVVFVGQFKRGKSSLINAFLGENILPSGLVPVTAVLTIIRFSPDRYCYLKLKHKDKENIDPGDLYLYVSQEENPDNTKGVEYVELGLPNDFLKKGLIIIDTPGISSVFESNTATTKDFVDNIDSAVVVLGNDPPISYDELQLIKQISKRVKELVFVINKVDKEDIKDVEVIKEFTKNILEKEALLKGVEIYSISAKDKINGRVTFDWDRFVKKIENMIENKAVIINNMAFNAVHRISKKLLKEIDRYMGVLKRPLEETQKELMALTQFKHESDIFITELGYRFLSEQERISQLIDVELKKFLERHKNEIESEFDAVFHSSGNKGGVIQNYYEEIYKIAEKYVYLYIDEISHISERLYGNVLLRYKEEFSKLLNNVKGALREEVFSELQFEVDFTMYSKSDFYFHHFMRYTSGSIFGFLLDLFQSKRKRTLRMKKNLREYLDWLIYANCVRYNGDINQRVNETRRMLETDFRRKVNELLERTNSSINYAESILREGRIRIEGELKRLQNLCMEISNLREEVIPKDQ